MIPEVKKQSFRLAAVLYADNNYEVTPKTIHKKIVESALLNSGKKELSVHGIIDYIQENYSIDFDEDEITSVVKGEKEDVFLTNQRNGDLFVCLAEKRKLVLQAKLSERNIDFFIEQFVKENQDLSAGANVKELVYSFLYELLNTNITSFRKLLDRDKEVDDLINVESNTYTATERAVINAFLSWENNDKNKAVFDIASYALEYCMLTNNSNGAAVHLSSLRNKVFYLDTNVVFRALGINGQDREKRTRTFLRKFVDAGEKLVISKFTEQEFRDSVKFYVNKLRRYPVRNLNPDVLNEKYFRSLRSFFDYYHQWRIGKVNDSHDLFEAYVLSHYDSFKREFSIDVDYKIPFDPSDEKIAKAISDIANDISSFKTAEGVNHGYDSSYTDACNVHLVNVRRDGNNINLFDSKYYFISTDQMLRRWDYYRTSVTPIVLLPSQWLSIVLRYVARSNDDFRSFVSFLNLPNPERTIDSEKLHIVLAGISEMTSNYMQQKLLVNTLVQNKFEGILDNGADSDEILERTKSYAKSALEKELEDITVKQAELLGQIAIQKEDADGRISDLSKEATSKDKRLREKEQENQKLRERLKRKTLEDQFNRWQSTAYWYLAFGIIIMLFTLLQFTLTDWEYNLPAKLVTWIDGLESETKQNTLRALIYAPLALVLVAGNMFYTRLWDIDSKETKRKELEKAYDE
ncbi:hypothetical protein JAO76_17825 [Pontibacter sp. BT310]|uniref:Uncharacterized protein n=1 Tax=Pontibacter populi TaxID=890055 RepID=A0ABS6XG15_9BACT|nr:MULTISPECIES: hypothetical protein [Pontibacter]MBJ6120070.1 hypothetical protein [Pontibacter sp. BT310]MBR0572499.1 hypothetical protein [Microvirga sp. STS03]MBW3366923.1 hypothetical protein [Pontibacter populi]